jgi:hypothetical protein
MSTVTQGRHNNRIWSSRDANNDHTSSIPVNYTDRSWSMFLVHGIAQGKAIRIEAGSSPEGSRRLRLQSAHEGGKFVSPTHWPPFPQELFLVHIYVRGWVDHRAIVGRKVYVNEKFQWHHRDRTRDHLASNALPQTGPPRAPFAQVQT